MHKLIRSMTSSLMVMLLLGVGLSAQQGARLADIDGQPITVEQFQMVLNEMRRTGSMDRTLETLTAAGREALLNALVEKQLYAVGAREEGFDRQPDVRFWIDQAIAEILASTYIASKAREVVVTDAALEEFYNAHPDLFTTPGRVKVRHILVRSREDADAVLREAGAGDDFEQLAAKRSIDAGTRATGGDLGWVARGLMVKPFEDLVFSTKKGAVGGPVETSLGFHVVKIDDVEAPALPKFDAIKSAVREKKIAAELTRLKEQLMARHPVRIERDALAAPAPRF
jgi:Parvulin-like peptidyl-prolyl isomerase